MAFKFVVLFLMSILFVGQSKGVPLKSSAEDLKVSEFFEANRNNFPKLFFILVLM